MSNRIIIDAQNPDRLLVEQAAACLRNGGVLLHATETVYGLAARWNAFEALERIRTIKGREQASPFSILVWDVEQIFTLSGQRSPALERFVRRLFPGPITLVLPRLAPLPGEWGELQAIGFRLPDHPLSIALAKQAGAALITTSANKSGQPPAADSSLLDPQVYNAVDLIIDSGICPLKTPSTVIKIDPQKSSLELLRDGAAPFQQIEATFRKCFPEGE